MRARRTSRGFTLIEILIAIVVLVLGITGILALFPTAIDSGNKTVEDSYSAAISQSVVDAITVGLRETRYTWQATDGDIYTYFLLEHDGVLDPQPTNPAQLDNGDDRMWNKDYCIIMPRFRDPDDGSVQEPAWGNVDKDFEPVFVYPVPASEDSIVPVTPPTGIHAVADPEKRSPTGALDTGELLDDFGAAAFSSTTTEETPALWLPRTFKLGRYRETGVTLPEGLGPGDIRLEFRGQDLVDPSITVTEPKMIALDPFPNYSFAFGIRRARIDTSGQRCPNDNTALSTPDFPQTCPGSCGEVLQHGAPDGMISPGQLPGFPDDAHPPADAFSNSLYQLRVMIFKGFRDDIAVELTPLDPPDPDAAIRVPNTNIPIKEFVTLISS